MEGTSDRLKHKLHWKYFSPSPYHAIYSLLDPQEDTSQFSRLSYKCEYSGDKKRSGTPPLVGFSDKGHQKGPLFSNLHGGTTQNAWYANPLNREPLLHPRYLELSAFFFISQSPHKQLCDSGYLWVPDGSHIFSCSWTEVEYTLCHMSPGLNL